MNNFDLLRLLAALQVAIIHAVELLHLHPGIIFKQILYFLFLFPGVPIFFFTSGFLISKSYENNHRIHEYVQNRVLRLYPGLFACVTLSFLLIYISGYMASTGKSASQWSLLYIAKITFVQFYNPDFMRAYGDGVLNGALWTISVELQFYVLVPLLYFLFKLKKTVNANRTLLILIAVFLILNMVYTRIPGEYRHTILFKLIRVSFIPWFYMFLTGIIVQRNFEFFHKLLSNKFIFIFPVYCFVGYLAIAYHLELGNEINPVVFAFLFMCVFAFSYSHSGLAKKLLKGNDISYGVYIYHSPMINFFLYSGYTGKISYAALALAIAIMIAMISWILIERNSLKLKKHPLNPLYVPKN